MMIATGDGLTPDECIALHLIAAEGRANDPCAWRADPDVIDRLRKALNGPITPQQAAEVLEARIKADIHLLMEASEIALHDMGEENPASSKQHHREYFLRPLTAIAQKEKD